MSELANLPERMIRGGTFLVLRRGAGLLIGLTGILVLSRVIGPAAYGRYAAAAAIVIFATAVAGLGVDAYLIRRPEAPDAAAYAEVLTVVLLSAAAVAAIGIACTPAIELIVGDSGYGGPILALLPTVMLTAAQLPASASLERSLDYRSLAVAELGGQIVFAISAISLAVAGLGVWAAVAAHWLWQIVLLLLLYRVAPVPLRVRWSSRSARELIRYAGTYSPGIWLSQSRNLVNPLVVGRYAGPEAVAYVSIAALAADRLSIFAHVGWRITFSGFTRLRETPDRLRAALRESMTLQILLSGAMLGGFAVVAPIAVPRLFGSTWQPLLEVYPLIACAYLVSAVFVGHAATLLVYGRNLALATFFGAHVGLLLILSLLLVPAFGAVGYGLAELGAVASFVLLHWQLRRAGLSVSYRTVGVWFLAFAPLVLLPLLPSRLAWLAVLPLATLLVLPHFRRQITSYAARLRRALTHPPAPS